MNSSRIWICYSFEQDCVHIEEEDIGLEINLRAFAQNRPVSYIPLAVFSSIAAASECAERLREIARERSVESVRRKERQREARS